ncbi:transmembrane envelope protein [Snakehead rhabdovirus]|uniref:Glycoprotein n=1 Tax=Snakehead rhabdovirus TaxID=103603 RepID=GLYCO_SHRV|nr:transmembrane envelope protein [Snakehead virus]Q9QJT6.1 RecName: Full=Glycoprotein; Flags: Precursor [Snakehead virus]AAD56769.1 transmembrane envelope protein [Snakehead virus]
MTLPNMKPKRIVLFLVFLNAWVSNAQVTHKPRPDSIVEYSEEWENPIYTTPSHCFEDTFAPVKPEKLRCPHIFDDQNLGLTASKAKILHMDLKPEDTHFEAKGRLLHKVTYQVLCSTGFFGGRTVTRKVLETPMGDNEAQAYKAVDREFPYFPEPLCFWLRDNVAAERVFHFSTPKTVTVDLYSRKYISPDFVGGQCAKSPCPTHWPNVYWVGETQSPECPSIDTEGGHIFTKKDTHRITKAVVHGHHPWGLTKACQIQFCNEQWIRTDLGDLIRIEPNDGTSSLTLPKCQDNVVQMRGNLDDFSYLNHAIVNMAQRSECLEAHSSIVAQQKVSPYLLSKFRPPHPGLGKAHYLQNNTIMRGDCIYEGVAEISENRTTYRNLKGEWKKWSLSRGGEGYDGMTVGTKIVIPDLEKYQSIYDNGMFIPKLLGEVPHPSIVITYNQTDSIETGIFTDGKLLNMGVNWTLWPSLSGISLFTVASLILIWYCCCRVTPQALNYSIPMHTITSRGVEI